MTTSPTPSRPITRLQVAPRRSVRLRQAAAVAAAAARINKKTRTTTKKTKKTKKRSAAKAKLQNLKTKISNKTARSAIRFRKKRSGPNVEQSPKKKQKRNSATVGLSFGIGVVDSEANIENGTIITLNDRLGGNAEPCDVMLKSIDPASSVDEFFVLQLIRKGEEEEYVVYMRWGATGTKGQALSKQFDGLDCFHSATKYFLEKFKEKTGEEWGNINDDDDDDEGNRAPGKYRRIRQNFDAKRAGYGGSTWQYWVEDGVDGKRPGWYNYEDAASRQVEQLYHEGANNKNLQLRCVKSGYFSYSVHLSKMTQTNLSTSTCRKIRRVPTGAVAGSLNDLD